MKTKKSESTNEISRFDNDIETLKADIVEIETELAVAANHVTSVGAERSRLALAARKDEHARAQLHELRARQTEAQLVVEEKQGALEQATAQLAELQAKRTEAFKRAKLHEYRAKSDEMIAQGEVIEQTLLSLIAAKAKFDHSILALDGLAVAAEIVVPSHRNLPKALRRAIGCRLGTNEIWLSTAARNVLNVPITDLFKHILNGRAVDEESAKKTANG